MRYLVLSDIHSNIGALEASLAQAGTVGYDRILCCGDIVGYGPDPAAVLDRLADLQAVCIRGNHDRVVSGLDEPTYFNTAARLAVEWTRRALPDAYLDRLAALPEGPRLVDGIQLVHGSLHDEDDYVVSEAEGMMALALTREPITFFGHTHLPGVFGTGDEEAAWCPAPGRSTFPLRTGMKYLVNPGSVGQPRDGDSRASFLIFDSDKAMLEFYRAEYDIAETQARMRAAGLPTSLATRLSAGK